MARLLKTTTISQLLQRFYPPLLCMVVLCSSMLPVWAFELKMEFGGSPGSECRKDFFNIFLAGTRPDMILRVVPSLGDDLSYAGVSDWSWPAGFTLEAGFGDSSAFAPDPAVLERLQPQYYVSLRRASLDSAWQQLKLIPLESQERWPEYCFSIKLPEDYAGRKICLRAHFSDTRFGALSTATHLCLQVLTPCSQPDRDLVWADQVRSAREARDYQRAIALADSFLLQGWNSRSGLYYAYASAMASGQAERGLHFLDTMYERYGTVFTFGDGGSEKDRAYYEKLRSDLLHTKQDSQPQH